MVDSLIPPAAVVAGVSPADIKKLQPAQLPLYGKAVIASAIHSVQKLLPQQRPRYVATYSWMEAI
jgi:hypothetical protein